MKKDFHNTLILSGSIILAFSQLPIYDSRKNLMGFTDPPGKFITILENAYVIPFLILGMIFVIWGIIGNLQANK